MIRRLLRERLSVRRKVQLLQWRDRVKFARCRLVRKPDTKMLQCSEITPIFVIGSNRSGASFCTQMLAEHPQVEGIFQEAEPGHQIAQDSHSVNNVEANHSWGILKNADHDLTQGENVLWGLPDFISKLYIKSVSDWDKHLLINELLTAGKTSRVPLVIKRLNILRIPLIKQLFPKARFVLVTRDYRSYFAS